ncbi:EndoU domain-containing protein [Pasteurella multocida]
MTVIVGGHSTLGNIRVDRVLQTYKNGVYIAQISVWDSDTNQYIAKTNNNGEMLMFPETWTADRILVEIDSAYSNQVDDLDAVRQAEGMWAGISNSGVRIEGYSYPEFTAFPSSAQE